jgi:hypothetical protein
MAIKYVWEILNITTAPKLVVNNLELADAITSVGFNYTGSDGTGEDKVSGTYSSNIDLPLPDDQNFIALKDLTEADIRGWCKDIQNVEGMKEIIIKNIEDQKVPKYVPTVLPWKNAESE